MSTTDPNRVTVLAKCFHPFGLLFRNSVISGADDRQVDRTLCAGIFRQLPRSGLT